MKSLLKDRKLVEITNLPITREIKIDVPMIAVTRKVYQILQTPKGLEEESPTEIRIRDLLLSLKTELRRIKERKDREGILAVVYKVSKKSNFVYMFHIIITSLNECIVALPEEYMGKLQN